MSRKRVLLGLAILAVLAATVAGVLAFLVHHEPDFYRTIALPPGQERQKRSKEFYETCSHLASALLSDREWSAKFTEARINSYLDEDFGRTGIPLPENISEPRVALIEPDRIRLAFRYGAEWWNTVITIDLRLWLVKSEANVVAMELIGLHAGSLPISAQSLLERVAEVGRGQDIEVTWYRDRSTSNPVALLRFQASQARPSVRLERLQIREGELEVGGRSNDPSPLRAMLAPSAKFQPLLAD
jgi:hypothetical protein